MHMLHVTTSFTYFTGSKIGPPRIKIMQKIVLFIDPAAEAYYTPSKIGNLFMNRFGIDEEARHEILKISRIFRKCVNLSTTKEVVMCSICMPTHFRSTQISLRNY